MKDYDIIMADDKTATIEFKQRIGHVEILTHRIDVEHKGKQTIFHVREYQE